MKKITFNWFIGILTIAMVMIIISQSTANCFNPEDGRPDRGFQHQDPIPPSPFVPPLPLGMKLLMDAQTRNVLSKITGKSLEEIEQRLACKPLPLFLEENGIAPETFRKEMDEQSMRLIGQAMAAGMITKLQSDEIQKKMKADNKPESCRRDFENPRR